MDDRVWLLSLMLGAAALAGCGETGITGSSGKRRSAGSIDAEETGAERRLAYLGFNTFRATGSPLRLTWCPFLSTRDTDSELAVGFAGLEK